MHNGKSAYAVGQPKPKRKRPRRRERRASDAFVAAAAGPGGLLDESREDLIRRRKAEQEKLVDRERSYANGLYISHNTARPTYARDYFSVPSQVALSKSPLALPSILFDMEDAAARKARRKQVLEQRKAQKELLGEFRPKTAPSPKGKGGKSPAKRPVSPSQTLRLQSLTRQELVEEASRRSEALKFSVMVDVRGTLPPKPEGDSDDEGVGRMQTAGAGAVVAPGTAAMPSRRESDADADSAGGADDTDGAQDGGSESQGDDGGVDAEAALVALEKLVHGGEGTHFGLPADTVPLRGATVTVEVHAPAPRPGSPTYAATLQRASSAARQYQRTVTAGPSTAGTLGGPYGDPDRAIDDRIAAVAAASAWTDTMGPHPGAGDGGVLGVTPMFPSGVSPPGSPTSASPAATRDRGKGVGSAARDRVPVSPAGSASGGKGRNRKRSAKGEGAGDASDLPAGFTSESSAIELGLPADDAAAAGSATVQLGSKLTRLQLVLADEEDASVRIEERRKIAERDRARAAKFSLRVQVSEARPAPTSKEVKRLLSPRQTDTLKLDGARVEVSWRDLNAQQELELRMAREAAARPSMPSMGPQQAHPWGVQGGGGGGGGAIGSGGDGGDGERESKGADADADAPPDATATSRRARGSAARGLPAGASMPASRTADGAPLPPFAIGFTEAPPSAKPKPKHGPGAASASAASAAGKGGKAGAEVALPMYMTEAEWEMEQKRRLGHSVWNPAPKRNRRASWVDDGASDASGAQHSDAEGGTDGEGDDSDVPGGAKRRLRKRRTYSEVTLKASADGWKGRRVVVSVTKEGYVPVTKVVRLLAATTTVGDVQLESQATVAAREARRAERDRRAEASKFGMVINVTRRFTGEPLWGCLAMLFNGKDVGPSSQVAQARCNKAGTARIEHAHPSWSRLRAGWLLRTRIKGYITVNTPLHLSQAATVVDVGMLTPEDDALFAVAVSARDACTGAGMKWANVEVCVPLAQYEDGPGAPQPPAEALLSASASLHSMGGAAGGLGRGASMRSLPRGDSMRSIRGAGAGGAAGGAVGGGASVGPDSPGGPGAGLQSQSLSRSIRTTTSFRDSQAMGGGPSGAMPSVGSDAANAAALLPMSKIAPPGAQLVVVGSAVSDEDGTAVVQCSYAHWRGCDLVVTAACEGYVSHPLMLKGVGNAPVAAAAEYAGDDDGNWSDAGAGPGAAKPKSRRDSTAAAASAAAKARRIAEEAGEIDDGVNRNVVNARPRDSTAAVQLVPLPEKGSGEMRVVLSWQPTAPAEARKPLHLHVQTPSNSDLSLFALAGKAPRVRDESLCTFEHPEPDVRRGEAAPDSASVVAAAAGKSPQVVRLSCPAGVNGWFRFAVHNREKKPSAAAGEGAGAGVKQGGRNKGRVCTAALQAQVIVVSERGVVGVHVPPSEAAACPYAATTGAVHPHAWWDVVALHGKLGTARPLRAFAGQMPPREAGLPQPFNVSALVTRVRKGGAPVHGAKATLRVAETGKGLAVGETDDDGNVELTAIYEHWRTQPLRITFAKAGFVEADCYYDYAALPNPKAPVPVSMFSTSDDTKFETAVTVVDSISKKPLRDIPVTVTVPKPVDPPPVPGAAAGAGGKAVSKKGKGKGDTTAAAAAPAAGASEGKAASAAAAGGEGSAGSKGTEVVPAPATGAAAGDARANGGDGDGDEGVPMKPIAPIPVLARVAGADGVDLGGGGGGGGAASARSGAGSEDDAASVASGVASVAGSVALSLPKTRDGKDDPDVAAAVAAAAAGPVAAKVADDSADGEGGAGGDAHDRAQGAQEDDVLLPRHKMRVIGAAKTDGRGVATVTSSCTGWRRKASASLVFAQAKHDTMFCPPLPLSIRGRRASAHQIPVVRKPPTGFLRVVLTWGSVPLDMALHVLTPSDAMRPARGDGDGDSGAAAGASSGAAAAKGKAKGKGDAKGDDGDDDAAAGHELDATRELGIAPGDLCSGQPVDKPARAHFEVASDRGGFGPEIAMLAAPKGASGWFRVCVHNASPVQQTVAGITEPALLNSAACVWVLSSNGVVAQFVVPGPDDPLSWGSEDGGVPPQSRAGHAWWDVCAIHGKTGQIVPLNDTALDRPLRTAGLPDAFAAGGDGDDDDDDDADHGGGAAAAAAGAGGGASGKRGGKSGGKGGRFARKVPESTGMSCSFTNRGDDQVLIGSTKAMGIVDTSLTIEAWIKVTHFGRMNTIVGTDKGGRNEKFRFAVKDGKLVGGFDDMNLVSMGKGDKPLPEDAWSHVAFVYDAQTLDMALYVNGVEVARSPNHKSLAGEQKLSLSRFGGSFGLNGSVSEVRIWRTVRTTREIQRDMGVRILDNDGNAAPDGDLAGAGGSGGDGGGAFGRRGLAACWGALATRHATMGHDSVWKCYKKGGAWGLKLAEDPLKAAWAAAQSAVAGAGPSPAGPSSGLYMSFPGTGREAVSIGTQNALGLCDSSFTVEAWVRVNRFANQAANAGGGGADGGGKAEDDRPDDEGAHNTIVAGDGTALQQDNGFLACTLRDAMPFFSLWGADARCIAGVRLRQKVWTHLAFVYDKRRREMSIHINGAIAARERDVAPLRGDHGAVPLSISRFNGKHGLDGDITELRIWREARTADQLQGYMRRRVLSPVPAKPAALLASAKGGSKGRGGRRGRRRKRKPKVSAEDAAEAAAARKEALKAYKQECRDTRALACCWATLASYSDPVLIAGEQAASKAPGVTLAWQPPFAAQDHLDGIEAREAAKRAAEAARLRLEAEEVARRVKEKEMARLGIHVTPRGTPRGGATPRGAPTPRGSVGAPTPRKAGAGGKGKGKGGGKGGKAGPGAGAKGKAAAEDTAASAASAASGAAAAEAAVPAKRQNPNADVVIAPWVRAVVKGAPKGRGMFHLQLPDVALAAVWGDTAIVESSDSEGEDDA